MNNAGLNCLISFYTFSHINFSRDAAVNVIIIAKNVRSQSWVGCIMSFSRKGSPYDEEERREIPSRWLQQDFSFYSPAWRQTGNDIKG
jgi:hypothetical protein